MSSPVDDCAIQHLGLIVIKDRRIADHLMIVKLFRDLFCEAYSPKTQGVMLNPFRHGHMGKKVPDPLPLK
jgi:hypothetical protein